MKKSLLTILCTLLSMMSWAQGTTAGDESSYEPYAALSENNTVLTFFYDENKANRNGMSVGPFSQASERGWDSNKTDITNVVFDDSFVNATNITSTAYWFTDCSSLTEIRGIGNLNTSNVTTMLWMFCGCTSLSSIDLSGFNTVNVTDMSYMFMRTGFTSLDLSSFSTYKVTQTDNMFRGCFGLTTIYVGSDWNMGAVTSGADMFLNCSNLVGGAGTTYNANRIDYTYAHIDGGENNPGYFTDKNAPASYVITVTSYGNGQVSVEGVPEVVEDGKKAEVAVTAGGSLEMFFFPGEGYQLDSLMVDGINVTADVVPATEQSAASYTLNNINAVHNVITYFGENASYNEAYGVLVIDENNTASLTMYYDANRDAHREGQVIGLDEMMQNQAWMMYRENVTTVVFDSSFANCRPTSTAFWFAYCRSLTSIVGLQYLRTDETTNMSFMFNECSSLTSLDLSSLNTENVTNISGMLGGCRSLTSVDLSGFNTRQVTNMNSLFEQSAALTTINLSSFNTSQVTDMSYMFNECSALTTIYVGSDWSTEAVTNGTDMFNKCTNLVGGAGTTYSADHVDHTYAHIDGGTANPGYFTAKNAAGTFDIRVSVYGNGEVSVGILPDVIVDGKSAVASVDAGGSLEMFFFPLDGYQIGSVVLDNNDVTADVTPATEYSAASYILNDINASHDITVTFTAKDGSGVVAPEFRFEGDNLTMSTTTQNASIFYKMADLASMDEAYVDSVTNSLVVTADAIHSTYYEQPFELKKNAVVKAIAVVDSPNGMVVSDTTTMVYDYEAWVNLKAAVTSGVDLYDRAKGNPNVDAQLLEDLQWALNEGDMIYNQRAQMDSFEAKHFTQRINELCAQIEAQMGGQKVATPTLKWENDNLTIETETQDADIFYWLSDTDVNGDGILDNGDYAKYSSALTIQRDVTIRAYAAKQGMTNSDTIQVVYPYTAWERLLDIIGVSKSIADQAYQNPKVPQDMVAELENGIMKGLDMYEVRTAEEAEINDMADRIRYMAYEIERMMQIEAQFEHGVLSVYGSTTMAEAVQEFGINNINETIAAIKWNSSSPLTNDDLRDITNPNLLIYVEDASLAPANRDNVVINGFAKNVVLSDVTSGNNNFYCPEEFTAEAISYTRNFQQQTEIGISRGWESIALPFDVQTIMHEKNGVLSPFGSSEGGKPFWLRQMSDNGLVQAIEIHANRPYLISMPNSTDYPAEFNQPGRVTFSSLNVRVPVTEEEVVAMADSTIVLIPTFQRMEQSDWIYALNVGETRAQYPEGSVFEQGLRAVRPFEAFTVHNNNQSNPAPRYIAINEIGNGTTGIENIVIKDVNALGDRWYSLDGRLLQGKPAQKGVYIYNGKKTIIK